VTIGSASGWPGSISSSAKAAGASEAGSISWPLRAASSAPELSPALRRRRPTVAQARPPVVGLLSSSTNACSTTEAASFLSAARE
jgi:hypothetical protein